MRAVLAGLVLTMFASSAVADDAGFTWGATAAGGYDSRGGLRAGFALAGGMRWGNFELAFEPRLIPAKIHFGYYPIVELDAVLRVYFEPLLYAEAAAGLALLPSTGGGDFIQVPDAQGCLSAGIGRMLVRSDRWLLDVRAIYTIEFGVKYEAGGSANVHSILVGPAMRFY